MHKLIYRIYILLFIIGSSFFSFGQDDRNLEDLSFKKSKKLFDNGEISEALTAFTSLYGNYPNDSEICYYYGASLVRKKIRPEEAIIALLKASTGNVPVNVFYYLGKACHLSYKFNEAELNFAKFRQRSNRAEVQSMNIDLMDSMLTNALFLTQNPSEYEIFEESIVDENEIIKKLIKYSEGVNWELMSDKLSSEMDIRYASRFPFIQSEKNGFTYFSSYGSDAEYGKEIYFLNNNDSDSKTKPLMVGIELSTNFAEINPVVSASSNKMYFCSNGYGSLGGFDVFSSEFDTVSGEWGRPVNMGFPINSVFDDFLFLPEINDSNVILVSNRNCQINEYRLFKIRNFNEQINFYGEKVLSDISMFDYSNSSLEESSDETLDFKFAILSENNELTNEEFNTERYADLAIINDYHNYLTNLITQTQAIYNEKIILSLRKKNDADKLKREGSLYSDKNRESNNKTSYQSLLDEVLVLENEAEFTEIYSNSMKVYLVRLKEFKSIANDITDAKYMALSGIEKLSLINKNRSLYNESSMLFVGFKSKTDKLKYESLVLQQDIKENNEKLDIVVKKIKVVEKQKLKSEGENVDTQVIESELVDLYIKKQFINKNITQLKVRKDDNEKEQLLYEDLIKELSKRAVWKFDFEKQNEEIDSIENGDTIIVKSITKDIPDFNYDFTGLKENDILTKIDFNEEEQKQIIKAEELLIDAERSMEKSLSSVEIRNSLQKKLRDKKRSSKPESIKKKISNQDDLIFKYNLETADYQYSSFDIKYNLLFDKLDNYRFSKQIGLPDINLEEQKAMSFRKDAVTQWDNAIERKNNLIEPYSFAVNLYDSAYNSMLKVYYVYLNLAPIYPASIIEDLEGPKPIISSNIDPIIAKEEVVKEEVIKEEIVNKVIEKHVRNFNEIGRINEHYLFFYTIQLGAFNESQKLLRFKSISPVYEQYDGKYYRYFAGIYKTQAKANKGRKLVVSQGIKDAYVVSFFETKRLTYNQSKEILEKGSVKYEEENLVRLINGEESKSSDSPNKDYEQGFYFTIQLSVLTDVSPDLGQFHVEPVYSQPYKNGKTRIVCGRFNTYESAVEAKNGVVSSIYPDAFIIAYYEGDLIDINKAKMLSESGENIIFASPAPVRVKNMLEGKTQDSSVIDEIEYRIQIASYRSEPSKEEVLILTNVAGDFDLMSFDNDNEMIIYTVGNFQRYNDALNKRKVILDRGAGEAIIHAFRGGLKIPVKDAISITE